MPCPIFIVSYGARTGLGRSVPEYCRREVIMLGHEPRVLPGFIARWGHSLLGPQIVREWRSLRR